LTNSNIPGEFDFVWFWCGSSGWITGVLLLEILSTLGSKQYFLRGCSFMWLVLRSSIEGGIEEKVKNKLFCERK